jgi:predicted lipid-binding transport protein (Tim44 family)
MLVVLLLALIWAGVLVPPAMRAHNARKHAFLVSIGTPEPDFAPPPRPYSRRVQARRRIAGGLLVAMACTLVVGLLPTFRVFLVVHLFLVDSFIAYIAVLAHMANRAARAASRPQQAAARPEEKVEEAPAGDAVEHVPLRARWRARRVIVPELGPVAPAG